MSGTTAAAHMVGVFATIVTDLGERRTGSMESLHLHHLMSWGQVSLTLHGSFLLSLTSPTVQPDLAPVNAKPKKKPDFSHLPPPPVLPLSWKPDEETPIYAESEGDAFCNVVFPAFSKASSTSVLAAPQQDPTLLTIPVLEAHTRSAAGSRDPRVMPNTTGKKSLPVGPLGMRSTPPVQQLSESPVMLDRRLWPEVEQWPNESDCE